MSAIKGIGVASVEAIVKARRKGRFTSLFDFIAKVEQGAVNRRGLESLICAGAFDSLKPASIHDKSLAGAVIRIGKQCINLRAKSME